MLATRSLLRIVNLVSATHLNWLIFALIKRFEMSSDDTAQICNHLAAESHVDRSIDGPTEFMQTNIFGTFNSWSNRENILKVV